jgi:hypothetical protein
MNEHDNYQRFFVVLCNSLAINLADKKSFVLKGNFYIHRLNNFLEQN